MKDWIQLQSHLYRSVKEEIELFEVPVSRELTTYGKVFQKDLSQLRDSDEAEFTRAFNRADTVFIGDFHPLRQSQRMLSRLLRDRKILKPHHLGFEILFPEHMAALRKWLDKKSSKAEATLQEKLELEKSWGTSWQTYREIFLLAHELKIQIVPLGSNKARLEARDRDAALGIKALPGRVWILFGEFHCARPHLPRIVQKIAPERKLFILQQNDDNASLKRLSRLSENKTLFLKAAQQEPPLFCVLHTPLWIKWQSHLERNLRQSDLSNRALEGLDPQEQILWSLKMLLGFIEDSRYKFPKSKDELLEFDLWLATEGSFYRTLAKLNPLEKREIVFDLEMGKISASAKRKHIYLSEVTFNSCAQAAATYLYRSLSGIEVGEGDFYKRAVVEAVSFFMSKLLNHSRKVNGWTFWERLAARKNPRQSEATAILSSQKFLERFHNRKNWINSLKPHDRTAAITLGRILATGVFEAFLIGEFSRSRLIRLALSPVQNELEALEILTELRSVSRPYEKSRWQESGI